MSIRVVLKRGTYVDSVSLMSLSTRANRIDGVDQAVVAMGTPMNKEVVRNVGLWSADVDAAEPGDLMIVLRAASNDRCEAALAEVNAMLAKPTAGRLVGSPRFATLSGAARQSPDANLAIISVPGEHAAREARLALDLGLHAMLFSDNVPLDDEVALKEYAHGKGLLVMGPDCGTAILGGTGLCFANAVRRGRIGIVAASGTGSQEISVRIHELGSGISQLIGTGGRDLSERVGGIMMIDALQALARDEDTDVIVLVSKPPAARVEQRVLAQVRACGKPVVVCFLDGSEAAVVEAGAHFAATTLEAASKAVELDGGRGSSGLKAHSDPQLIQSVRMKLQPRQRYIRALMCGGTLCDELASLAGRHLSGIYSNVANDPKRRLIDPSHSREHTFIDFGDDVFTVGRPHPMIDPSQRIERLLLEARDPEVAVIVMDFILGFGAHEDPAGAMLPAIREGKAFAAREGRHLEIVGHVLGTEDDRPSLGEQVAKLHDVGVTIAGSCTRAGMLARAFVARDLLS